MLMHRNDAACQGKGFYTYEAFIAAADAFDGFGTTGDDDTKKREIAAFLAQTSHETTGPSAQQEQCGSQAGGKVCPGRLCCSKFGFCGTTAAYCSSSNISSLISKAEFENMLKRRNNAACEGIGFYSYEAFIAAADAFVGFGTTGDNSTKKREIAAFLAQTSHETTGGWPTAPNGPYAWGYCFVTEQGNPPDYCDENQQQYPCTPGKKYYGRGPIILTYNFNYGPAGIAIGSDLLNNPDLVATDPTISFKTALWFWMTPQSPQPSCHDVITGRWTPSAADLAAGLVPGYGVITNIMNGGIECGKGSTRQQEDRIGFYKRYCDIMGVGYGNNIDCNNQSRSPRSSNVLVLQCTM